MSRINVANFRHPDGTSDNINLTDTGRVGIGTTSPATSLDVTGSAFAPATFGRNGGATNTTGSGVIAFSNLGTPGGSSNADMILRSDYALAAQINNASSATNALIVDTSNNFKFNSGYGSVATAYGVRAWINFDGTAGTIGTGRASGNMDAVTDNGSGDYTVNFTNDMPDANYCVAGICFETGSTGATDNFIGIKRATNYSDSVTAGSVRIATNGGGDRSCFVMIVR